MRTLFFLFACFVFASAHAQLQSPKEFLGYEIGSRFTPHHRLAAYFEYVAGKAPETVKLLKYGETNEGRPLLLAFISLKENIDRLETIRENNLRLTTDRNGQTPENQPVLVWLSYNVHGNEASSSEASMLTLYKLAAERDDQTEEWLRNVVVVMDPCMNPDGRDRYVNWYNSVVGKHFNPKAISREHQEPWPGGRSNHYYFDLNRDWAWQTQVESRQRMTQYNRWVPQIHVDFHEQGYNSPYYFAPAAKPYHEALTSWQREFQQTLGRNHAKYFDQNNWLYFTKEIFDLFYPSYGDTYPLYTGAMGMTYEQAGSGAAGLGIQTAEGDTLTLRDRALHHYTSGISTIEIAAKNRQKLLDEFAGFYRGALSGNAGTYKTYIIKNKPEDAQRLGALRELLRKNLIEWGSGSGRVSGFNYATGREESIQIGTEDLVISTAQPRGNLVNILFEPRTALEDSVTYDITAWALPYVFGLEALATKQKIRVTPASTSDLEKNLPEPAYAYAFDWQGVASAKAAAALLQRGVRLRYATSPFTVDGHSFGRGAVIITGKGNEKFADTLNRLVGDICHDNNVSCKGLSTGYADSGYDFGSSSVKYLKPLRVGMLTGEGVSSLNTGEIWNFFDNTLNYPLTLINQKNAANIPWTDLDVLILPEGKFDLFESEKSQEPMVDWIKGGGRLIAFGDAVHQISKQKWSNLKEREDTSAPSKESLFKRYEDREKESVASNTPGAIFKVKVDSTHPLMFGYADSYYSMKLDDRAYEYMEKGWNVGIAEESTPIAGFVGNRLMPKLKERMVFGVQEIGRGSVVYLTDNVLFRDFWEGGKLIFCNAVFHE